MRCCPLFSFPSYRLLIAVPLVSAALTATRGWAQTVPFQSPGLPITGPLGQTTRFTNDFNPAIGVVVDGVLDYLNPDNGEQGFDFMLRHLELNMASQVDPNAWAYAVVVSEDLESPIVEEAAVQFTGLAPRTDVRVGRFFIDFGKQMQLHPEDLRTQSRALVLREYLGEELGGTGVRVNHWLPINDTTPLRFSLGVFESLLSESEAGEASGPLAEVSDRQDLADLSFSGRVTAMTEIGGGSILQAGASARTVPSFDFIDDSTGLAASNLSNTVWGLDLTYSTANETGIRRFTSGLEWLFTSGDLSGQVDDAGTPLDASDDFVAVTNDTVGGFVIFAEYNWNQFNSVGTQFSLADRLADPDASAQELDFFWTRLLTEFNRLRIGATVAEDDLDGDAVRGYVQFTAFLGTHAHGLNW
jgi:hypothetical protein